MSNRKIVFTQEVKDKWVEALKSPKYHNSKGMGELRTIGNGRTTYCCIGVLCDITPELGISHDGVNLKNGVAYFGMHDVSIEHQPLGIPDKDVRNLIHQNDSINVKDGTFQNMIQHILDLPVSTE